MTAHRPAAVLVLAAGGGTRMKTTTPKTLHQVGGRSLLGHVVHAARGLQPDHLVVVVRHQRDRVAPHVVELDADAVIADQDEIAGTGRAAECGLSSLSADLSGTVVVTYGDVPLQTTATLASLVERHSAEANAVTVLTAEPADPFGYGRILRDSAGGVTAIVEEKDATSDQRSVREVNSGIFAFDAAFLRSALSRVGTDNTQSEKYLTDVVAIAVGDGRRVGGLRADDVWETEGVNTLAQLSDLGRELNRRQLKRWMGQGVEVIDPSTTWLDVTVELAPDVVLKPGVQLHGATRVATAAVIGPDTTLTDVSIGAGAHVVRCHGSSAVVGERCTVGPFAYLRPGTVLGSAGKIGTFVETKNARIADGAKVPHLSYVGDATIGEGTNIGAGTIFANYDGSAKHHTTVGEHCKTGAQNTFVAPVQIGNGAATGAGTVVRRDVPPGALAVSTGPQRHIDGWVQRRRAGTAAAEAAAAAGAESPPTATSEEAPG